MTGPSANGHDEELFDLDAAAAAAAVDEAEERPFAFSFHGERYTIPSPKRWPLSAQRDLEAGLLEETFPKLVGADTFERMIEAGASFGDLELVFEEIARRSKMSLPNSARRSRPGTTRTSKRR